jgi:hypothetical protein
VEVFRRTLVARLAPLLVAGGALALLISDAMAGTLTLSLWSVIAAGIAVAAGIGALMALGDEVQVSEAGVRLHNHYLRRERSIAWDDIQEVRSVNARVGGRLRAVFVIPYRGPRLILDSLNSMERIAELLEAGKRQPERPDL